MTPTPNRSGTGSANSGKFKLSLTRLTGSVWSNLPLILFVLAIALASFGYGGLVGKYRLFPYTIIADGYKTGRQLLGRGVETTDQGEFVEFTDIPLGDVSLSRFEFVAGEALHESVLWYGGHFQFLELCPESGCLAVEYTATGEVAHAWPLRPHELKEAAVGYEEFPYELATDHSFVRDVYPFGMSRYPNGDLLVIFHGRNAHPFGGGMARIDRDGRPVWFRRDYSHHWPQLLDDGTALVPGTRIGDKSIAFERSNGEMATIRCDSDNPYLDTVNVVDGDGRLLKRIDLVDALVTSKFASVLLSTVAACDPLHLNFIHQLGDDAGGAQGIAPGDLVVSLRSLSAFGILDSESGRLKRLVRGSFSQQHSVQHLRGSHFLMLDNHGYADVDGPSRLLMVDISATIFPNDSTPNSSWPRRRGGPSQPLIFNISDGRETTIFPNDSTPEALRGLFTRWRGNIDISNDRERVIVAFTKAGVAVEVRLSDGEVLNIFTSLHDVSSLEQFSEERTTMAGRFAIQGIDYVETSRE